MARVIVQRLAVGLLLILTVVHQAVVGSARAQSREDSNGIFQIIAIGQFSPEDEARIRQLRQAAARPAGGQQPPIAGPPSVPGAAPPAPPAAAPPGPPAAAPPGAAAPPAVLPPAGPLQPGEVGPRTPPRGGGGNVTPRQATPAQPAQPAAADRPIFTAGTGTGFLVRGSRTVATNNHVSIAPDARIGNQTFRPNRTTYFAAYLKDGVAQLTPLRLLARNPEKDVSLLEAEADLPGRAFAVADYDPRLDLDVDAIGFPGVTEIASVAADQRVIETTIGLQVPLSMSQLQPVKTQGRVQRIVDAQVRVSGEPLRARTILHTATISPGNSGGPLLNRCGQVVGMNTFTRNEGTTARADFAVHTRELLDVMRANRIEPVVASGFCLFPGTATDYLPHLAGLASLLLGATAVMFTVLRKPQIVYQTAQRVSRVFSRPVNSKAAPREDDSQRRPPRPDRGERAPRAERREESGERPPRSDRRDRDERRPQAERSDQRRGSAITDASHAAEQQTLVPRLSPTGVREVRLVSPQGRPTVVLASEVLTNGRSAILGRETSSDALLEETSVSRRHARLTLDAAGNLMVTDLGSANGTWRESRNISTATYAPGEEVRFGTQRYVLEVDPPPPQSGGPRWLLTGSGEKGEYVHVVLVPLGDHGTGEPIESEWTLGRNENAVNIAIKSSDVSSNHALLRFKPGQGLQIADRGSANGTWLSGERVGADFVDLGDNASVRLGETELVIERV